MNVYQSASFKTNILVPNILKRKEGLYYAIIRNREIVHTYFFFCALMNDNNNKDEEYYPKLERKSRGRDKSKPVKTITNQDLERVEKDFFQCVSRLYDLFPNPDIRIEDESEASEGGRILQSQQCHWYKERLLPVEFRQDPTTRMRCQERALSFAWFCERHVTYAYPNLIVKESFLPNAGLGLFTRIGAASVIDRDQEIVFVKDDIIAPYFGSHSFEAPRNSNYVYTINKEGLSKELLVNIPREYHINPQGWRIVFFFLIVYNNTLLGTQTCIARYANHASGEKANAKVLPWPIPGISPTTFYPCLVATRDIPQNTEILFDYGTEFGFKEEEVEREKKRAKTDDISSHARHMERLHF